MTWNNKTGHSKLSAFLISVSFMVLLSTVVFLSGCSSDTSPNNNSDTPNQNTQPATSSTSTQSPSANTNVIESNSASGMYESQVAVVRDGVQYVQSTMDSSHYQPIRVKLGVPVKWTLNAPGGSLNDCNSSILIPEYNIKLDLRAGDNAIGFTPDKSGTFVINCWMEMLFSMIEVEAEDGTVADYGDYYCFEPGEDCCE